ncbi:hypothetical protein BN174_4310004 [Clostridioides difficile E15]|nr:hypothetical protein BN174_4310004 [Clostridioides difficile E15]
MLVPYGRATFEYQRTAAYRLEHSIPISEWQHKTHGHTLHDSISHSGGAGVRIGYFPVRPLPAGQDKTALSPSKAVTDDTGKWLV